jgi:hypothetical protein
MWKHREFSVICAVVFLVWTATNGLEVLLFKYWRDFEGFEAREFSLMYAPSPIAGLVIILVMGFVTHRVPALAITTTGLVLSLAAPLSIICMKARSVGSTYFASSQYLRAIGKAE